MIWAFSDGTMMWGRIEAGAATAVQLATDGLRPDPGADMVTPRVGRLASRPTAVETGPETGMRILGIVANTHDSGIALVDDGVPEIVIEEERLNRVKKTRRFPEQALTAAFDERGLSIGAVDVVTTPWDVKRLRKTVASVLLKGFPASLNLLHQSAHRGQRNQIVFLNRYLADGLAAHFKSDTLPPIVNVGHHESHAAAFLVSPFEEAAVLVMDGYGDEHATSVFAGSGNRLERQWAMDIMNSLGLVYTFVTEFLGFRAFHDEGKVMGLAAYGTPAYAERFRKLVELTDDHRYRVDMSYFSYDRYGQLRPLRDRFLKVFGTPRAAGQPLTQVHRDIACGLQTMLEETVLHVVRGLERQFTTRNLVLSGGVALNCVANARILRETAFEHVWVPPGASDCGAPLGSALWHHHVTLGARRHFELTHAFYGRAASDDEIEAAFEAAGLAYRRLDDAALIEETARAIADGAVVGWFQGRFEMGPRALGNRSILADPRRADMKDIINVRIKHREEFRPFAPAILQEHASAFFEIDQPDPFMTIAPKVRTEKAGLIPAVVHADGTGRIQTVSHNANPRYYELIAAFYRLTGVPVLLNTSFNRQEPMVARASEAVSCYLRTDMDRVVIGNYVCTDRTAQAVALARAAHDRD
jgi:carbamoyltransferase